MFQSYAALLSSIVVSSLVVHQVCSQYAGDGDDGLTQGVIISNNCSNQNLAYWTVTYAGLFGPARLNYSMWYPLESDGTQPITNFTLGVISQNNNDNYEIGMYNKEIELFYFNTSSDPFDQSVSYYIDRTYGAPKYGNPVSSITPSDANAGIDDTCYSCSSIALGYDANASFIGPGWCHRSCILTVTLCWNDGKIG